MFVVTKPSFGEREPQTRQRLLDAAGEVFADRGFRDATVREICAKAGANVAAVNYHFRDKEGLYQEVLRYADRCAAEFRARAEQFAQVGAAPLGAAGAESRLRAFIAAYVAAMLDTGRPSWHGRLIAREMADPSPMLDRIIDENIRPRSELLSEILAELLGPAATPQLIARCKFSIIGQCLIYHCGRHVVERLHPDCALRESSVDAVAAHIVEFSLSAIAAIRARHEGRTCLADGSRDEEAQA